MTIRYTCTGCESVLKIKDDKAGTKGRCPKCKMEFVVPQLASGEESPPVSDAADQPDESVDMPIDLTPEMADSSDFDPADVLGISATPARAFGFGSTPAGGDRKPSVAELMRDFEATKKKDRKEKSAPEISRPVASAAASAMSSADQTAGSAASALSRAYQQKRESASAPTVRPQDVKAAEQKALMIGFIKTRALPGIIAVALLGYGYIWWMNYEAYTGLPLVDVTGAVTKGGQPAAGVSLTFIPTIKDSQEDKRTMASGTTDKDGKFVLQYVAGHEGAPVGEYDIQVFGADGNPANLVGGESHVTVREDGANDFKFEL